MLITGVEVTDFREMQETETIDQCKARYRDFNSGERKFRRLCTWVQKAHQPIKKTKISFQRLKWNCSHGSGTVIE